MFLDAVNCLEELRSFSGLTFDRNGDRLYATVRPASARKGAALGTRVWAFQQDGTSSQITHGPNNDSSPAPSPSDDQIAFISDREIRGKMRLYLLGSNGRVDALPDIDGTVESFSWTASGRHIVAIAADRGLTGGATSGATRIWWGEPQDPEVTTARPALRRLLSFDLENDTVCEVGPLDLTVWEFCLIPGGAIAVVSEDATERGWHHPRLARIDFRSRSVEFLYTSEWQVQGLTYHAASERLAFLEGWSSDRGLVAGEIRILELKTGAIRQVVSRYSNITSLQWHDAETLRFTGWKRLGSVYGTLSLDGQILEDTYEEAVVGESTFVARRAMNADGTRVAAVRESIGLPQEIYLKAEGGWKPLTRFNVGVAENYPEYPEIKHIIWTGEDGLELESFLIVPRGLGPGPHPMVVDIHGGPCTSSKFSFDPCSGLGFAAAGYVVFVPNYRGNVGWGQEFTRKNIGDPAGAEFGDIMRGVDRCIELGLADPDRIGITGRSYGGFLTAWAVAVTDRFKAAIPVASICNQISVHYSSDNDFHEFINGASLRDPNARRLALERSPILRMVNPTTPTLLIQGKEDTCTPLSQAQEFYAALQERGAVSELVAYPREGHGFREREHRVDAWVRRVSWFDRYLR